MRLVIIESPYAGDVETNVEYARRCVRDSLERGEAPIASHLLYTQPGILDDNIPSERQWGIDAGLAWRKVAEASVVYSDYGISSGMKYGVKAAEESGKKVEWRSIGINPRKPASDRVTSDFSKPICNGCGQPIDWHHIPLDVPELETYGGMPRPKPPEIPAFPMPKTGWQRLREWWAT